MIAGLKPYPQTKDSGVPWIGEVPEHWSLRRLKNVARNINDQTTESDRAKRYIGLEHIESWSGRIRPATADSVDGQVKRFHAGNVLFGKLRPYLAKVVRPSFDGVCTGELLVLQTAESNAPYIEQLLRSASFINVVNSTTFGAKMPRAEWDVIGTFPIPLPPSTEQVAIVHFLETVDRKINQFIRAKRQMIGLLAEQKQAVITHAVTRGLDPNVRLRPSGIDWLGDLPEHWEILRCRYLFREVDNRSKDGLEQHLSMSQRLGLVPSHLVENRTLVSENYAGGKLCVPNDLVLNRLKAHLGVFSVAQDAGVISPDYTVLRPKEPDSVTYFEQVLRSPSFRQELRKRAKGIVEGFWRLYTDDFYNLRLPVPPEAERLAIINYTHTATSEIDQTVARAEREIDLIREFRARLIADVVTGKLDVREVTARLPVEPIDRASIDDLGILNTYDLESEENLDLTEEAANADD